MIDAAAFSHSSKNGADVHIRFVDWIPGICSSLGMLVINSIEKTRLSADSYSYSGTGVAWKAQLVLFLGFALMAGGLAGSVVSYTSYMDTDGISELRKCLLIIRGLFRLSWRLNISSRASLGPHYILGLQMLSQMG